MKRYEFFYNEPRVGFIDIDGPDMTEEDILRQIEQQYPEAVDVELGTYDDKGLAI
jgi:hypothetical protein